MEIFHSESDSGQQTMSGYGVSSSSSSSTYGIADLTKYLSAMSGGALYHRNFSNLVYMIFSRDTPLPFNCQNSSVATNAEKLKESGIEQR